jgi:RNA-binding protein YhbY
LATNTRSTYTAKLPTIQVGKQGITENTLAEVKKQLKKHKQVRVKLLRSAPVTKERLKDLASEVNSTAEKIVGRVVVLKKQ